MTSYVYDTYNDNWIAVPHDDPIFADCSWEEHEDFFGFKCLVTFDKVLFNGRLMEEEEQE